jgi:hypothetical protein
MSIFGSAKSSDFTHLARVLTGAIEPTRANVYVQRSAHLVTADEVYVWRQYTLISHNTRHVIKILEHQKTRNRCRKMRTLVMIEDLI